MKIRHVFALRDLEQTVRAVDAARAAGLGEDALSLLARRDIRLQQIPDSLKQAGGDFVPGALRGMVGGGSIGLLAGLLAAAVPAAGITVAGALLMGATGAAVGGWSAAMVGAAVPDEVQRLFRARIERGEILLVVDAEPDTLEALEPALRAAGAFRVDYEAPTALA